MRRFTVGLAVVAIVLAVASTGRAATVYSIIDLGDLPGGENSSDARRINAAGQVIGASETTFGRHGYLYSGGVLTDIGVLTGHRSSEATDINDAGQIAGRSINEEYDRSFGPILYSSQRPILYSDGTMIELGSFGGGYGFAYGINNASEVVGLSSYSSGATHAFLYSDGSMTDLGSLDGSYSCAYDINNNSEVVGTSTVNRAARGFRWKDGIMTDLGDLPSGLETTRAYAINDAGQVVGESAVASATIGHAFLWQDDVMTDLGVLSGTDSSLAMGLNEYGQVVGTSYNPETDEDHRAFLWDNANGMQDLNDFLDTSGIGWTLHGANDINDAGQIVGTGTNPDGDTHGYLLTPQRELFAGDANQDYVFDQADIGQVFLANKYLTGQPATWGEGDWDGAPGGERGNPPPGDGVFDQNDIIAALAPGHYLSGPYAAIRWDGVRGDGQTSIIYDVKTGEIAVDAPARTELTSINIDSAGCNFDPAQNPTRHEYETDLECNIFEARFGSSFGSVSFGNVFEPNLSKEFVANDLTVVGSLVGGRDLGDVDLIYIPEPSTLLLGISAFAAIFARRWR